MTFSTTTAFGRSLELNSCPIASRPLSGPYPTDGALIVANARDNDRQRVYRPLMVYTGAVVLVAPALAWALLVPTGIM